jgi:ABC-type multidrug transport system ATPase subunit
MKLLEVRDLTFGYEDTPVLDGFNLELLPNEILLIDGENGVGKTTLLKCMTNIINNGIGIFINGTNIQNDKRALKQVSFIMSDDTLYDYLTLNENIGFFKLLFGEGDDFMPKVRNLCADFDIAKYEHYLVKNLSQGTRHKLYLAIMLSKQHNILILDEPFTALDKKTQKLMIEKIKNNGPDTNRSVIIVTHVSEFKQLATRTVYVNKITN